MDRATWPETRWTLIERSADLAAPAAREHLGFLISRYREPLRGFLAQCVRGRAGLDPDDLVQEFLTLKWLEGTMLARVRRDGPGRFRCFLKKAARDFVVDRLRATRGARATVRLGGDGAAGADAGPAGDPARSEAFVDAADALDFEIALGDLRAALAALEAECRAEDRLPLFRALLARFERRGGRDGADRELAAGLGLPRST
ncbi:MAG: hypothetical protein HZA54_08330, partial [Planctomycetes bacterium]|nr:hypothetical protein [Planctomycetota bacterium]